MNKVVKFGLISVAVAGVCAGVVALAKKCAAHDKIDDVTDLSGVEDEHFQKCTCECGSHEQCNDPECPCEAHAEPHAEDCQCDECECHEEKNQAENVSEDVEENVETERESEDAAEAQVNAEN